MHDSALPTALLLPCGLHYWVRNWEWESCRKNSTTAADGKKGSVFSWLLRKKQHFPGKSGVCIFNFKQRWGSTLPVKMICYFKMFPLAQTPSTLYRVMHNSVISENSPKYIFLLHKKPGSPLIIFFCTNGNVTHFILLPNIKLKKIPQMWYSAKLPFIKLRGIISRSNATFN